MGSFNLSIDISTPNQNIHLLKRKMNTVFVFVFAFAALINISIGRPSPDNAPASYSSAPTYASEPANYNYEWTVKDDYSNNNYGQAETRNGDNTSGSYYVLLPDGRTQTVTYSVDGYGGYVADVTYSGEAKYPETPKYKPAPSYPSA